MPGENQRETGARAPLEKDRPDANDDFSQAAAENKKPASGVGLTEKVSEPSEADKSDLVDPSPGTPEPEAQGDATFPSRKKS